VAIGKISTDTTHRAVPRRQLSFLFDMSSSSETLGRRERLLSTAIEDVCGEFSALGKKYLKSEFQIAKERPWTCLHSCSRHPVSPVVQLLWLHLKHRIDFKIASIAFRTLNSSQPACCCQVRLFVSLHCTLFIRHSVICFPFRFSTLHLAPAVLVLQPKNL